MSSSSSLIYGSLFSIKTMSHSYRSEVPQGIQLDDGIRTFFEEFYETSDTPDAHDKYANSLTADADFIMASKKAKGRDGEILIFTNLILLIWFWEWCLRDMLFLQISGSFLYCQSDSGSLSCRSIFYLILSKLHMEHTEIERRSS